jgi:hypothetical protein
MLEPREAKAELQRKISSALEPAFRAPARPGGGILGRFELTGKVPPGEDRRMTYEIRLAPDGKEVNVYRNDLPKEMSFLRGDTLAFVRSQAASSVYEVVVMSRRAPQR